jgi:hypothetical protein
VGVARSKKRFSEYSPIQRLVIVALATVSIGLVGAAERDIQRRRPDQVRGSRQLWRLLCLNALGAAAYLRWGRRASQ